jgi:hypothetical protein
MHRRTMQGRGQPLDRWSHLSSQYSESSGGIAEMTGSTVVPPLGPSSLTRNGTVLHMRLADGSPAIPQRDENLSMVTDTSGRIFLYVPDREGKGKDRFYWYRLSASMTSPQVVTADGIYAIDSSHVSCWYQGGTSARVDADGALQLMCGENDFSRADKNDLRMYFWMHPCDGDGYRTWGVPSACTSP